MAQSRFYSATAQPTVLTASITPTTTIISVQQTVGFPSNVPYILALDYNTPSEEVVLVTSQAGTSLTVTRAYDSTSASSHNAGAAVRHTWTAMDGNDSRLHEGSTSGIHGVTGNIVGDTATQTLTNKTIVSPSITGTVTGAATYNNIGIVTPTITAGGSWVGSPSLTSPSISSPTITGTVINSSVITPSAIGITPIQARGLAGQTGDLVQIQDSSSNNLFRLTPSGAVRVSTLNTGVAQVVVNGPTALASDLTTFQVNAVTVARVDSAGIIHGLQGVRAGTADQFIVDNTGAITAAANLNTGAWISYTPAWTSTGTQPVIGNGTIAGRYTQTGKTITVMVTLTMGSTTTFGTGVYSFSVPFVSVNRANNVWNGSGLGTDTGNANYPAITNIGNNSSTFVAVTSTTASGAAPSAWSNAVPFTWGNTDMMSFSITYEMA